MSATTNTEPAAPNTTLFVAVFIYHDEPPNIVGPFQTFAQAQDCVDDEMCNAIESYAVELIKP